LLWRLKADAKGLDVPNESGPMRVRPSDVAKSSSISNIELAPWWRVQRKGAAARRGTAALRV